MYTLFEHTFAIGLGLIFFKVSGGCKWTGENDWVITFKLPSWLNISIPIHIKEMKEDASILHLSLLLHCV